jgi:hypothetical protein
LVCAAPPATQADSSAESQPTAAGIQAVEAHWTQAFIHGDTAYLDSLFAPNYVSVNASGVVRDRAAVITLAVVMSKKTLPPFPAPVLHVDVHGDAAIVTSSDGGQQSVDAFYYSKGAWHAWYSQHTTIAKP